MLQVSIISQQEICTLAIIVVQSVSKKIEARPLSVHVTCYRRGIFSFRLEKAIILLTNNCSKHYEKVLGMNEEQPLRGTTHTHVRMSP